MAQARPDRTAHRPPERLDRVDLRQVLPHSGLMLQLDTVDGEDGPWLLGRRFVLDDEVWVPGHFDGDPIMPGALQLEVMGQLCAVIAIRALDLHARDVHLRFPGADRVRYHRPIRPRDTLALRARLTGRTGPIWRFEAEGRLGSERACSAALTLWVERRREPAPRAAPDSPLSEDLEPLMRREVGPHTFIAGVVRTPRALDAHYQLRHRAFVRPGMWPPSALQHGDHARRWERDRYDAHAVHLVATLDERPVAAVRLLPCERPYPMLDGAYGQPIPAPAHDPETGAPLPPERVVEASRWVAEPTVLDSGQTAMISTLMAEATFRAAHAMGRSHLVTTIRAASLRRFAELGWRYTLLPPGRLDYRGHALDAIVAPVVEYVAPRLLAPSGQPATP